MKYCQEVIEKHGPELINHSRGTGAAWDSEWYRQRPFGKAHQLLESQENDLKGMERAAL